MIYLSAFVARSVLSLPRSGGCGLSARGVSFLPFLLFFFSFALPLRSQGSIVIGPPDASGWPTVSADIYPLDEKGRNIGGFDAGSVTVTENGSPVPVSLFECPVRSPNEAISAVLTVDVSGSMANPGTPRGAANIDLAREAVRAWIAALPEEGSESAITAFDDEGVVLRDLTRDRETLLGAVEMLHPQKGTNYQAALLGTPAGALRVVRFGEHKRVIVFLTDGLSNADPAPIIEEARRLNATIFCVTLGMKAPAVLHEISRQTGGDVFENVTTTDEARAVYRAILYRSRGGRPCRLVWSSPPDCSPDRTVMISIPSRSISATASYRAPEGSVPRLQASPPHAAIPAGGGEIPITVTAVGRPVRLERIEPIRVDPGLSLDAPALPLVVTPGEPVRITVRFSDRRGGSAAGRWRLLNDGCTPAVINVRSGAEGEDFPVIHLAAPNGGERFRMGEAALLSWDGVPTGTPVRLEYSTDAGSSWKKIAENVTGGLLPWRVPGTPSERCLARVSTMTESEGEAPELERLAALPIRNHLYALDPAGNRIAGYLGDTVVTATASRGGRANQPAGIYGMWNAATGELMKTWVVVGDDFTSYKDPTPEFVEFSPDGSMMLCGNYMLDAGTGEILWWTNGRPVNQQGYMLTDVMTPSFSPDGKYVLLRVPEGGGEVLGVLDARTGKRVSMMGLNTLSVSTGVFSPDGSEVLTASREGVNVWNARTGAQVRRFTSDETYSATLSPDGRMVASVHDDSVRIWNRGTGEFIGRFYLGKNTNGYRSARFAPDGSPVVWRDQTPGLLDMARDDTTVTFIERDERGRPKGIPARIVFSPDGSYAVTIGGRAGNRTEVNVYDAVTGERVGRTGKDGSVIGLSGQVTPAGRRLLWSFGDSLIIAPLVPGAASQDVSDDLWAIIGRSQPALADVDFGPLPVGRARDSVIVGFVRNDGDLPMLVESVAIAGANAGDFTHVSGVPPFPVPPGESRPVEFRFAPSAAGNRVASATLVIDGVPVSGALRGEGRPATLGLNVLNVDFGVVPVGNSRDTVISAMIRNSGSSSVTVTGIRMIGPDTTNFSYTGKNSRFSISPGGSHPVSLAFSPDDAGLFSTRIVFEVSEGEPLVAYAHGRGAGWPVAERYSDPTTFRTMAVPNGVIPEGGTIVAGSYDLLGLMAGYAVTDNIMILAGGAPPLPDDWGGINGVMFGAYSLGLKVGTSFGDRWKIAAGFQWAQSVYDREETKELDSRITAPTPYMAVSYGDDDRRISLTAGSAAKSHRAVTDDATERIEEFDRNAPIVALGGDWRIGDRWKIVAEGIYMKTVGTAPVIATARWFGRTWALDFGAAYLGISTGDGEGSSIPLAPVVSFVWIMR